MAMQWVPLVTKKCVLLLKVRLDTKAPKNSLTFTILLHFTFSYWICRLRIYLFTLDVRLNQFILINLWHIDDTLIARFQSWTAWNGCSGAICPYISYIHKIHPSDHSLSKKDDKVKLYRIKHKTYAISKSVIRTLPGFT